MMCPFCGAALADGAGFCATCGRQVGATPGAGTPPPLPMQGAAQKTSGLAIAGLVTAFFCGLVGLVLSILGLSQIKKSNGAIGGSGLAIAGIIVSLLNFVGTMAAVSIPAFLTYMKKSKSVEANLKLNQLGKAAKVYWVTNDKFPDGPAPLTPAESCCHQPGGKCAVSPTQWQQPAWNVLDFSVDEPGRFQYSYTTTATSFDAIAVGDLDCDDHPSTYHLHVEVVNGNPQTTLTGPN